MGHGHSILTRGVEHLLAVLAVFAIRVYQLTWSRLHGRTCLFSPSCSRRAIGYFRGYGFMEGLRRTRAQLSDCCGDYSMRFDEGGRVELVTRSGAIVPETELNPRITARVAFARDLARVGASFDVPSPRGNPQDGSVAVGELRAPTGSFPAVE